MVGLLASFLGLVCSHLASNASIEKIIAEFLSRLRHLIGLHAGAGRSSCSERGSKGSLLTILAFQECQLSEAADMASAPLGL